MANPPSSSQIEIAFRISKTETADFAELVKHLARRDIWARCAHAFSSAICIAASVAFYLKE